MRDVIRKLKFDWIDSSKQLICPAAPMIDGQDLNFLFQDEHDVKPSTMGTIESIDSLDFAGPSKITGEVLNQLTRMNAKQLSPACYYIQCLESCPTVRELFNISSALAESGVVLDETPFFDTEKPGAYVTFFVNVDEIYMADVHRDILAPWTLTINGKTKCKLRTENQTFTSLDGKKETGVRFSFCSKHPRGAPITKKVAVFPVNSQTKPHSGFIIYKIERAFNLCDFTSVKGLTRKRRINAPNDQETTQFIDSFLKTEAMEKEAGQKKLGRCMGKLSKLEDKMSQIRKQGYMAVLNGDEEYLDYLLDQTAQLLDLEKYQDIGSSNGY